MRSHLLRTTTRPSHSLEHDCFDGLVLGSGTGIAMLVARVVLAGLVEDATMRLAQLGIITVLGVAMARTRSLEAGVTAAVVVWAVNGGW